jgi:hypothetical protein
MGYSEIYKCAGCRQEVQGNFNDDGELLSKDGCKCNPKFKLADYDIKEANKKLEVIMSERKSTLLEALVKFQKTVKVIPKEEFNPHFKSYFAGLSTIVNICMPVLNECGLAVSQTMAVTDGRSTIVTTLLHDSGNIKSEMFLPEIADPQKLTAAITYLRRTQYISILGLVADDDDDGNASATQEEKRQGEKSPPKEPPRDIASEAQKKYMKQLKIEFKEDVSKTEAAKLIKDKVGK